MRKRDDSLPSLGYTTISVDKPTKERLLRLAGDTPVFLKMRQIIEEYDERDPAVPLSGLGHTVPKNTPATKKDLKELNYTNMSTLGVVTTTMMAVILDFYGLHPDKAMLARLENEFDKRLSERKQIQGEWDFTPELA